MKILVMSDSHMYNDILEKIISKYEEDVDMIIHCGDSSLPYDHPLMKKCHIRVLGNHDTGNYPKYVIHKNILITHGHLFQIYHGYEKLVDLCAANHCKICFHGHTHVPTIQRIKGITFINPGSIMINRGTYGYGTYAIVEVNNETIDVNFHNSETLERCSFSIIEEGLRTLDEFKQLCKV